MKFNIVPSGKCELESNIPWTPENGSIHSLCCSCSKIAEPGFFVRDKGGSQYVWCGECVTNSGIMREFRARNRRLWNRNKNRDMWIQVLDIAREDPNEWVGIDYCTRCLGPTDLRGRILTHLPYKASRIEFIVLCENCAAKKGHLW